MSAICESAVLHSDLQEALKDSLEPVIELLCSSFQRLKLKDGPFLCSLQQVLKNWARW